MTMLTRKTKAASLAMVAIAAFAIAAPQALDDYRPAAAAAKELVDDEPQAPFSPGEFVQV